MNPPYEFISDNPRTFFAKDGYPYNVIPEPKFSTVRECLQFFFQTSSIAPELFISNNTIHCYANRHRSIQDSFYFCRHRFPDCSVEDVVLAMYDLWEEKAISGYFCYEIRKYVFSYLKYPEFQFPNVRGTPGNLDANTYPEYIAWSNYFDHLDIF